MQIIMALIAGLVFGLGLILSGMTNPAKVIGFLDLAGDWDPSLAFVMAGAIAVSFLPFQLAGKRSRTLLGGPVRLPATGHIERRLVFGSLAFGIGWGLAGYCPGPALTSLLSGGVKPVIFVVSMLAGMAVFELLNRRPWAGRQMQPGRNAGVDL
jgi:uncharacterized membrane protein YedE/YeeE